MLQSFSELRRTKRRCRCQISLTGRNPKRDKKRKQDRWTGLKSIQHIILCAGTSGTNEATGTKSTNCTFFNVKYTYVRIGYVARTRKKLTWTAQRAQTLQMAQTAQSAQTAQISYAFDIRLISICRLPPFCPVLVSSRGATLCIGFPYLSFCRNNTVGLHHKNHFMHTLSFYISLDLSFSIFTMIRVSKIQTMPETFIYKQCLDIFSNLWIIWY